VTFALDATPLTLTSGGLPRYVAELSTALATHFPAHQFLLTSDQPFSFPETTNLRNLHIAPGPRNALERRWWLWGASRARYDVFHGTNFAIPYLSRRPTVLSIHDLSPWMDPTWHANADRVRNHTPRMIRFGPATMILTPTYVVRQQVIDHFHIAPERVAAVHHAAASHFAPTGEPEEPYFLFVGTLEPRKNIQLLLEAWRELNREIKVRLVLAGRRRADFPELPREPCLEVLGEVPESRLPSLYSRALALVYPSLYEGFGLPVVEAMQCGACVIASRDPALTEVSEGAAIQATTAAELFAAMRAVATDPGLRAAQREKSLRRARDFTWQRTASMTYDIYQEALVRFGKS
jgi:glycosyltransferase involved in cell wall biosynthesis